MARTPSSALRPDGPTWPRGRSKTDAVLASAIESHRSALNSSAASRHDTADVEVDLRSTAALRGPERRAVGSIRVRRGEPPRRRLCHPITNQFVARSKASRMRVPDAGSVPTRSER
jgi:hypothetical protein